MLKKLFRPDVVEFTIIRVSKPQKTVTPINPFNPDANRVARMYGKHIARVALQCSDLIDEQTKKLGANVFLPLQDVRVVISPFGRVEVYVTPNIPDSLK